MLRNGQKINFAEADVAAIQCFVNKCYWIGFRVDKLKLTIECVDSFWRHFNECNEQGSVLRDFLNLLSEEIIVYRGRPSFPTQDNQMDCGIVVPLACRNWILQGDMPQDIV